jgi:methyl-accepting chemotaxis protein
MKIIRTGYLSSINFKIQLAFGVIYVIVMSAIGYSITASLSAGFERQSRLEIGNTTELIYQLTDSYVDTSVRNYLIGLAEAGKRIAEYEYRRFRNGEQTERQAWDRTRQLLLDPKFGKIGDTGYVAGVSGKGVLVMHPKSEGADASGHAFMKRATMMKEGYIEYLWKNPGEEVERSKAGGMAYFQPWDLIIWASSYKNEFHSLVDLAELERRILSIRIGERGYPYIMNSRGDILIHPTLKGQNLYNTQAADGRYFIREILQQKDGFIRYEMVDDAIGDEAIAYSRHYPELDLTIVSKAYADDMFGLLNRVRLISIIVAAIGFLVTNFMLILVLSRILRPLARMNELTVQIVAGNLTQRVEEISKDEIGAMATHFNQLVDTTERMLKQIKATAAELFDAVQNLSVSSQEITATSNQQAAAVKEIVSTMEDSDQLSKSIAGRIGEVTRISGQTREVVQTGFDTVRGSLDKMNEIKASNSETINGIKSLGERIDSIWDIVNIINGIADQTKIIAFNAELEASAAGDAGKNFQIVATEIRRLADSTMSSTNEIKSKINEIQHSSDNLIIASEQGTERIREGSELAANLRRIFEDVLSSAEISAESAERIATSINQQVSAFEQILQTLKQISEGIDNFVVSTKSTATASVRLKEMAEDLNEIVAQYQVSNDGQ